MNALSIARPSFPLFWGITFALAGGVKSVQPHPSTMHGQGWGR